MLFLDQIKKLALSSIDKLNILVNPYQEFTRDLNEIDSKDLKIKADYYWKDLRAFYLYGPQREFYWHSSRNDLGDMCIWQGVYTAMNIFKYTHTKDPLSLNGALVGLEGMNKLQTLSGTNRLLRGADSISGPYAPDPSRRYYYNGEYIYIDNVSESSLIGHLFGIWSFYYFGIKSPLVEKMIEGLANQLITDDYTLKNVDGTVAKFGDLKPTFFTAPIRVVALGTLFSLAYVITKKQDYRERFKKIYKENRSSFLCPETHFLWIHPYYQDILAYFCLTMLLTVEKSIENKDEEIVKDLLKSFETLWKKTRKDGNAFYYGMYKLSTEKELVDYRMQAIKTLHEFDTVNNGGKKKVKVVNSTDLSITKTTWGFGKQKQIIAKQPLPVWKRPGGDFIWQRDPRTLDGDLGYLDVAETYNGMDFLIAYYLLCLI